MGQLLAFLYKYRAFLLFLFLQSICVWLIVGNNDYQRSAFINGASGFIGIVNQTTNGIGDYFELSRVNEELAAENAMLRQMLQQQDQGITLDSLDRFIIDNDSLDSVQYLYIPAEVVQNSTRRTNNFFMINKGAEDSIRQDMAVVNSFGVVGKIRSVSDRFALGISLLNTKNPISVKHKKSGRSGTLQWAGLNPRNSDLLYITPDVDLVEGDTIMTSSYNAIFPPDVMVGTVSSVEQTANQTYLRIKVDLSVDFGKLSHVYVVDNVFKPEQDSLVAVTPMIDNEP